MIYNFWKRSILTFVVLFAPMLFSMVLLSCRDDDDDPILEIVGQDIQVLQEGIYTDVLIYVQYKLNEISTSRLFNSNSLLNPLYATSPGPPNIISLITDLNITSPIDFNSDFPAGSELLSIFQIELYQDSDEDESFPIKIGENRGLFLSLKVAPAINILATFEITTTLDDGTVFTSQSEPLKIEL